MNSFVLIDDDVGWCLRDDSVVDIGKVDNKTDVVVKGKEVSTVVWTSGDILFFHLTQKQYSDKSLYTTVTCNLV